MKAIVYHNYGGPEQLNIEEVPEPKMGPKDVLVKVRAASLNASDIEMLTANPSYIRAWGLFRPKYKILGSDLAGQVVAVGEQVKDFKINDLVFGDNFDRWGALAQFASVPENKLVILPEEISIQQAAAIPQAAVVALQGLGYPDHQLKDKEVLIVGAGGGAGCFAIQLAKLQGAIVTAVDKKSKQDVMQDLGVDAVIDYQTQDYSLEKNKFDYILDLVGSLNIWKNKACLKKGGRYVMVGGSVPRLFSALVFGSLISLTSSKKMKILAHKQTRKEMQRIVDLILSKKIRTTISKEYPIERTAEAFQHHIDGQLAGKTIILVD